MATAPEARSIGELLRDLASDSASLVQQEFALARAEAEDKLHQMIMAAIRAARRRLGGVCGADRAARRRGLRPAEAGLQRWLAALIVGGVVAVIGFLLVRKGQNDLAATRLAPERTAANLRKDLDLVKEQVS